MHELEPLADEREGFIEPALERPLQLLIDRRTHGVELLPELESLTGEVVAQTPFEPLVRPLGGIEPEQEGMKIDARFSSRDDEERDESDELKGGQDEEKRKHLA